jgi:drug/metabolite transporter (DMT)-like permease
MKLGMDRLTAFQVAAIRIASAGIILLPVSIRHIKNIPLNQLGLIFLSCALGSLIPAFLFCVAESRIDSALAGTLNSLTPIFAIIIGALLFGSKIQSSKVWGIIIAFAGSVLLLFNKGFKQDENTIYSYYVILATVLYGVNVNLVHKYLHDISSLKIASVGLSLCAIPAVIVLIYTEYFSLPLTQTDYLLSSIWSAILGIAGTAFATILFYVLIKRAGAIFSSMVTYGIPFVAIFWGLFIHETVTWKQMGALVLILFGIYMANRSPKLIALPD